MTNKVLCMAFIVCKSHEFICSGLNTSATECTGDR